MKTFAILFFLFLSILACTHLKTENELLTESEPKGYIDSLSNEMIMKLELPYKG